MAKYLHDPATGDRIAAIREDTIGDVKRMMAKAHASQRAWASLPVGNRLPLILAMRDAVVARAEELSRIISRSTGKPRADAMATEILPCALAASHYAKIAPAVLRPRRLARSSILFFNKVSRIERVPFGVVGIISPWNYPFSIPFHEVVTAFLSGNAVLLKVATQAQLVGEAIAGLIKESGLPDGLFHLVHMPGPMAGAAFLEARVDKLFFTGSANTGREIMKNAAVRLVPLVLELGGNDAMIVLEDANLERAAAGAAWAGYTNAGQNCAAVERIFIVEAAFERFRSLLAQEVAALRLGPDKDFDVDVGSLTLVQQMQKTRRFVADALAKGAAIAARSGLPEGESPLFHPALVLENVSKSMLIMKEEVFGPVLSIEKVRNEKEAACRANESSFGLTASVWSGNRSRARRLASCLEAGTVMINDHLMSHGMPETPWGGFKDSGFGRTHGRLGFEEMTQPRVVVDDRLHRLPRNMWWFPYDRALYDGLRAAMVLLFGKGPGRRIAAFVRVIRVFSRSFRRAKMRSKG